MAQLFAYGVLIRELAKGRAAELVAPLGPATPATTRGALYALRQEGGGWYPILLPDSAGGLVHGKLSNAAGVDWPAMDDFEDATGGADAEYARLHVPVMARGETLQAFAYCYARPLPADAVAIAHGDFARWLAESGNAAIDSR